MSAVAKPFRKLEERPRTSLLRLPAWVRGYLDEMLRIAERPSGRICDAATALDDVAFAIRAHADELPMLSKAIDLLCAEGALVVRDGILWWADFADSQRNYEAARKAAQRAKTSAPGNNVPDSPGVSHNSGTVPQDQRRSDEKEPPNPQRGRVRKARYTDPEERRRIRNRLAEDAKEGFHGPEAQRRAIAGWRTNDGALGILVDELESGQHPRMSLRLALPPAAGAEA